VRKVRKGYGSGAFRTSRTFRKGIGKIAAARQSEEGWTVTDRTDDEDAAYDGLGFVARRWLQLNEEAGRIVRERLKDRARPRVRECVDWLRAMGLTEREIINMLHGMAEFLEDELESADEATANDGGSDESSRPAALFPRPFSRRDFFPYKKGM
jgi:hypothetical protein